VIDEGIPLTAGVSSLQRMSAKRNRLYSGRFLAVINQHRLRIDMVWSVPFTCLEPTAGRSSKGQATRIGHIGMAAERR
jgi:hypothetical protein